MSCVCQRDGHKINARVAQLVEHNLAKVGAAGSSPVSRSNIKKSDSKRNRSFLLRAPPWLEVRGLDCRLGRSKTVSTGHQLRLALYTVRSISTPFSSIAFKSSSNASSSVIRTSKALIGQILIIESVPILLVG